MSNPNGTRRIVWAGWQLGFRPVFLGAPEAFRVVIEDGVWLHGGDSPGPEGERVMGTAHGGGVLGNHVAIRRQGGDGVWPEKLDLSETARDDP